MALKLQTPTTSDPLEKKPASTTLLEVLAAIRKEKGPKVIVSGDQIAIPRRLPTGVFEFDFYTGGGFPCGRYSIVYGPESSCKTNMCLKAVAVAQSLPGPCNKAIWVNIEQSFDPAWATIMGVDVKKLLVVEAGYGEEAVDLVDALVRADDVAILVADSIAGLIASKEIAQSTEKYDIGTSALLIKRMVNKLMVAFCDERKKGHDPCVILINQTRFKPGVVYGDPETMPGGEAQKFLASLRVRFYAKNIIDKPLSTLMFKDVHAVIKKAKVPVRAVDFDFEFCVSAHDDLKIGETNSFNMVKSHLQALGLLHKTPKGYVLSGLDMPRVWSTLTAFQDQYMKVSHFQREVQALVIARTKEKLILVDEPTFEPKDVAPGVQSSATNEPTT